MKSGSIWVGHDYAHVRYRGRGVRYHHNVQRIRVEKVEKHEPSDYHKQYFGKKNATTVITGTILHWDGTPIEGQEPIEVRGYDIIDFWDDYYGEFQEQLDAHAEQVKQRREREAEERILREQRMKERREREERERIELRERLAREEIERAERKKREAAEKELILARLTIRYGLNNVRFGYSGELIVDRPELLRWLGIPTHEGIKA